MLADDYASGMFLLSRDPEPTPESDGKFNAWGCASRQQMVW